MRIYNHYSRLSEITPDTGSGFTCAQFSWGARSVRRSRVGLLRASVAAICVLAMAGAAQAQTSAAGNAPASNSSGQDAEIIVTAQKRSASVQGIPAAITAISGANLNQRGISSVENLQFAVPSFRTAPLMGSTGISIRGVGATNIGSSNMGVTAIVG